MVMTDLDCGLPSAVEQAIASSPQRAIDMPEIIGCIIAQGASDSNGWRRSSFLRSCGAVCRSWRALVDLQAEHDRAVDNKDKLVPVQAE